MHGQNESNIAYSGYLTGYGLLSESPKNGHFIIFHIGHVLKVV